MVALGPTTRGAGDDCHSVFNSQLPLHAVDVGSTVSEERIAADIGAAFAGQKHGHGTDVLLRITDTARWHLLQDGGQHVGVGGEVVPRLRATGRRADHVAGDTVAAPLDGRGTARARTASLLAL